MPRHITVLPASPKTALAAIEALLADPSAPHVHGVYRSLARVPKHLLENPKFTATEGDLSQGPDGINLGEKCDAVLCVTPPLYGATDIEGGIEGFARRVSENQREVIKKKGVERVVYLSSGGAEFERGVGEILSNHIGEQTLKDAAPEVIYARVCYFMENWQMWMEMVQHESAFYTMITPLDYKISMIAVKDIGASLAASLLSPPLPSTSTPAPYIYDLLGPKSYSSLDVAAALSAATGKEVTAKAVERGDIRGFLEETAGFPPDTADMWTEMSLSFLEGGLIEAKKYEKECESRGQVKRGQTGLEDTVKSWFQ